MSDLVSYNGNSYAALVDNTNVVPTTTSTWLFIPVFKTFSQTYTASGSVSIPSTAVAGTVFVTFIAGSGGGSAGGDSGTPNCACGFVYDGSETPPFYCPSGSAQDPNGKGGAGSGGFQNVPLNPNDALSWTLGLGGAGSSSPFSNGSGGTDTVLTVNSSLTLTAKAGSGGIAANNLGTALGGSFTASNSTYNQYGKNGASVSSGQNGGNAAVQLNGEKGGLAGNGRFSTCDGNGNLSASSPPTSGSAGSNGFVLVTYTYTA